ncbi:hypothetical protein llap_22095 [Limosa lapponica baueri]|uniref:Uncharacterized protein n=1 Tax=Limosa lapponica baueri TaxID=1758121 RepID=A0A2I0T1D7_LIMLA|nr:hypothetical protein llap_22095 [Limosa lapponica baueri]
MRGGMLIPPYHRDNEESSLQEGLLIVYAEVVQPHFKAHQQIVRYFGTEILLENGEINREALGNIIFSNPEKRQLLNSITHPEIQKEMLKQILKYFVLELIKAEPCDS